MKKIPFTITVAVLLFGLAVTAYAEDNQQYIPLPEAEGSFTVRDVTPESGPYSFGAKPQEEESFDYTLEEFAALHLAETNKIRVQYGLPELQTDPVLTEMAQARMEENNFVMTHERPDGSMYWTIFDEYDTDLKANGENIAGAGGTPESCAWGFLQTSHRENVLRENSTHVGIAVEWVETIVGPRIAVLQLYARE